MTADVIRIAGPVVEMDDDQVRAAHRALVLHRRAERTNRCRRCGCRWQAGRTRSGRPVAGCFRRRRVLDLLDQAGLLDQEVTGDAG